MSFTKDFSLRETPQSEPLPGQVKNRAGGHAWQLSDKQRLLRFLILGSEGGTYYVDQARLTRENAQAVVRCCQQDPEGTVDLIVEVSRQGRAPKNDYALFALAICFGVLKGQGQYRELLAEALKQVARTGTHIIQFGQMVQQMRGSGRMLRYAFRRWYQDKSDEELAYQLLKYQRREGRSHKYTLKAGHPRPTDQRRTALYGLATGKPLQDVYPFLEGIPYVDGYYKVLQAQSAKEVAELIRQYRLTREVVPSQWQTAPEVLEALMEHMPDIALVRMLNRLTAAGVIKPLSSKLDWVLERIGRLKRVHPLALLVALRTYQAGEGLRGSLTWEPVPQVVTALEEAFYASFKQVEPTGKRILLALDVSGSMWRDTVAGSPIKPAEGAAALAMVTARTEKRYHVVAFSHEMVPLSISASDSLEAVDRRMRDMPMGGTDCALPMLHALEKGLEVDAFVVLTDNETWYGDIHPAQALRKYRERTGIPAKLVVVGMEGDKFSIADPDDPGMLDVVGFDTAAPQLMADFIRGEI